VRVVHDLPRPVREIEHTLIALADGCRLAARIWLPADAEDDPVPAVLEYLPYRKTDGTVARDMPRHPYVAGHGYACLRVDLRGSGESDGVLPDEYTEQELADAEEVIAWIARQPWCTGAVGMFGISWGGFNGLQVAARRPPALRAVVTLCSTDDRYADDVHYKGGCLLAWDQLPWAVSMLAFNARPPDPRLVGERWREMWLERLDKPPYIETWMEHQRRDGYWCHGSVCEDYAAIECPVYAIGGWADGYTNAVPRLLAGLPGRSKGLIGPWSHSFPDESVPGPSIGFLQECVRWWDRWLKGVRNGVDEEPVLRAWMQEAVRPAPHYELRPGRWVAERAWPSARIEPLTLYPREAGLAASPPAGSAVELRSPLAAGEDAGVWCRGGQDGEEPPDQRREDGMALAFTSEPLAEPLELLGFPELRLSLTSDRPLALIAARLTDVFPDGASLLVSRGLLNLAHRAGHEEPLPLPPGEPFEVAFPLDVLGHVVPAGHRIRLALSSSYWPWAWPSPETAMLTLHLGEGSSVTLPVRPRDPADVTLPPFGEPEGAAPLAMETLRPGDGELVRRRDAASGRVEQRFAWDLGGLVHFRDIDLEAEDTTVTDFSIVEGDPLSAHVRCRATTSMARGGWGIRVEIDSSMSADAEAFDLETELEAFEGESSVFRKRWTRRVPRDHI
jgi:uncharacterized protein